MQTRVSLPRNAKVQAMIHIEQIHTWEACDEESSAFRVMAAQIERELVHEVLCSAELEQIEEGGQDERESEEEEEEELEDERLSDWIDDDLDSDSEGEWLPQKRRRAASGEPALAQEGAAPGAAPGDEGPRPATDGPALPAAGPALPAAGPCAGPEAHSGPAAAENRPHADGEEEGVEMETGSASAVTM